MLIKTRRKALIALSILIIQFSNFKNELCQEFANFLLLQMEQISFNPLLISTSQKTMKNLRCSITGGQPIQSSQNNFPIKKTYSLCKQIGLPFQRSEIKIRTHSRQRVRTSQIKRSDTQGNFQEKRVERVGEQISTQKDTSIQNQNIGFFSKGNKKNMNNLRVLQTKVRKLINFQLVMEEKISFEEKIKIWAKNIFQDKQKTWNSSQKICIISPQKKSYEIFQFKSIHPSVPIKETNIMQYCYQYYRIQSSIDSSFKMFFCVLFGHEEPLLSFFWVNRPIQSNFQECILQELAKQIQLYVHPSLDSTTKTDSIIHLCNAWGKMSYIRLNILIPRIFKLRNENTRLQRSGIQDIENILYRKKYLKLFYIPPAYNRSKNNRLRLENKERSKF